MVRAMELRHLRYFAAVAAELNFTKAAQKLRVAQPALSRQIRQLEEETGARLLERAPRGVRLTAAGEVFLKEAEGILARSEQAIQAARASGKAAALHLNLGYVWGLFHTIAPRAIERLRARHPGAAVNLFDLTATRQAAQLLEGKIDAGFIGFADEAEAAGLARRKVAECSFVAALPRGHPAARKRRVPLRSLANDFFFTIAEENYPGAFRLIQGACERAGFKPKILQAAERGHTALGLVAGNCGVALLPEPLRALPHPGVVFRPLEETLAADLFIAWNDRRPSMLRDELLKALVKDSAMEPAP